jgi:hypothetical protein
MKSFEDIDTTTGTWSVPEKRMEKNRQNLLGFFSDIDNYGRVRKSAVETFEPDVFIKIMRLFLYHENEMSHIQGFVNRFRKSANEITDDNIREVLKQLAVNDVMDS